MKGKRLLFVMLVLAVVIILNADISGAQSAGECRQERRALVNACKSVLIKRSPSSYCCERIRATHTHCVCSVMTRSVAAMIDVNYRIKVVQKCGRYVPRHFKCGSIITP